MKKKLIIGGWVIVIFLFGVTVIRPMILDYMRKVKFEDEKMGFVIRSSSEEKSEEKFRENNLDEVTYLNIMYPGWYDTLVDIEKCKKLKTLEIGHWEYVSGKDMSDKDWIQQMEEELDGITKSCSEINSLMLVGSEGHFELDDLEFLKNAQNLKDLTLFYQPAKDYSAISEIPHLKSLFFNGCNIAEMNMLEGLTEVKSLWIKGCDVSKAGQIVNLKSLKDLDLENTPLAGNAEELGIIFANCPNIEKLNLSVKEGKLSDLNFLENAENLKELILTNQSLTDYSLIAKCCKLKNLSLGGCEISDLSILNGLDNLERLGLRGTNVSEAKDILKLKNLKYLYITDTPLAENEEQIELIEKQFPGIEIYK